MNDERPYAYVFCEGGFDGDGGSVSCGQVPLTLAEYTAQLARPNRPWMCPKCGAGAQYDDAGSEKLQQEREVAPFWSLEQAVELATKVEPILNRYGCHVALTGGALYKGGLRKDCDLIVYRHGLNAGEERGSFDETVQREDLLFGLSEIGMTIAREYTRVVKMLYGPDTKRVDLIFPELDGECLSGEEGTDLLGEDSSSPQDIKELAYKLDPECWVSYSGKPRDFKRALDKRRTAALSNARKQLEVPA